MYKPIKKLGQNFLSDPDISYGMVDALDIGEDEVIVEIGPGHGFITTELANRISGSSNEMYAIEIDSRFFAKLEEAYSVYNNIYIVNQDILDWLPDFTPHKDVRVIGSLPYYITSPIIHAVIKMKRLPEKCVFLIQKEVAKKISAAAPDASYLSSFTQSFYDVEYLADIPRQKFNPVPKVDGGIVSLTKKTESYSAEFVQKYEGFLHKGFKNPRKMLNKAFSRDELSIGGIDAKLRPQNLAASDWISFFRKLNPGVF